MNKIFYITTILISTSFCSISTSIDYALTGVSKSASSITTSVSKSVESVSDSVSDFVSSSSGSDDQSFLYNKDIKSVTAFYYNNKKIETLEFKAQIKTIANQNGITNWQNNYLTYYSIGQGLKVAGASENYLKNVFSESINKDTYNTLKKGYYSL